MPLLVYKQQVYASLGPLTWTGQHQTQNLLSDIGHISTEDISDWMLGIGFYIHIAYSIAIGKISVENVSFGHLSSVFINMILAIVITILMVSSVAPLWCEMPNQLNLIYIWLLISLYLNPETLNATLKVWYPLLNTPWIWASFSNTGLDLIIYVVFIVTVCFMIVKLLKGPTHQHPDEYISDGFGLSILTGSIPRRPLFLYAISVEWTTSCESIISTDFLSF